MRKFIAALVAVCLAGLGVIGLATASSAHVGDIQASGVCLDADTMTATYTVGWSNGTATGNLYQRSGTHGQQGNAGSSTSGWTHVKAVAGANGSTTFTVNHEKSTFSGSNGPWWSSKVIFSDGYGVAADTRVEGFDWSKCAPDTSENKIVVCHANQGVNDFSRVEVSKASFYEGHRVHGGDIYPAGSYEKGGTSYSWAAQGDQSLLQYEKCKKPDVVITVEFPDPTPPTCTSGALLPNLPANTDKVTWAFNGLTLTATAKAGFKFANGTTVSKTYTLAGLDLTKCPEALAGYDVQPPTCADLDGNATLAYVNASVTSVTRDGVSQPVGNYPSAYFETPPAGAYVITLTADAGYAFSGGQPTKTLTFSVVHKTSLDEDCLSPVTVVFPNPTPPTCDADGSLPQTPQQEGVSFTWDGLTLTATAVTGYKIVGPTSRTYEEPGDATGYQNENPEAPCYRAVPVAPSITVNEACGTENDFFTPGDGAGIDYLNAGYNDETKVYTVSPLAGYVIVLGPGSVFTLNENGSAWVDLNEFWSDEECVITNEGVESVCVGDVPYLQYDLTLPEDYTGPEDVTITFSDGENSYTLPGTYALSDTVLWPGASIDPDNWPGWVLNDEGTYSETDGNFAWTRDGVTVTFEVNPTLVVEGLAYPESSALCANPPLLEVTPVIYQYDVCGSDNDGWYFGDDENVGLTYVQRGTIVTFQALPGYAVVAANGFVLNEDGTASFDLNTWLWNDEACPVSYTPPAPQAPRLAETGSQPFFLGGIALSLLALGGVAIWAKRRRITD